MTKRFGNHRLLRSLAGITLLVGVGVGCGSDDDDDSAETTAAPAQTTAAPAATQAPAATEAPAASGGGLTISDFSYSDFTGKAGEEFTITNEDGFGHTVTSDSFDVTVDANGTAPLTIDAAGTYSIFCKFHSEMGGTITIE